MKSATALRVLRDSYLSGSARERYWRLPAALGEWRRLLRPENAKFRGYVIRDLSRRAFGSVVPVRGETVPRARAAVRWLLEAQRATPDDGVSHGYFPCAQDSGPWKP